MAEAYGSRTHPRLRRQPCNSFEDCGAHRDPYTSIGRERRTLRLTLSSTPRIVKCHVTEIHVKHETRARSVGRSNRCCFDTGTDKGESPCLGRPHAGHVAQEYDHAPLLSRQLDYPLGWTVQQAWLCILTIAEDRVYGGVHGCPAWVPRMRETIPLASASPAARASKPRYVSADVFESPGSAW